jgi:EmrB/QacA subfamily drug resistance transporter
MGPASAVARHLVFVLAALAVLMASIDLTIVAVALPQLTMAFQAPLTWTSWTLTAYQLVQVVMLPLAGRLSDTLGRKRVFLFCVGTFTTGSLLCGVAPSIGLLIAFRALQAVGGGGLLPSAIGLISDQYQKHRQQAIGLLSSVLPIGGIIGPNLGGYILEHWTWREIFFINVPIGAAVFVGVWLLLQEPQVGWRWPRVDPIGLAMFSAALALLMYGMTVLADNPELRRSPGPWTLLAASVVLFILFLRNSRRSSNPVIQYRLLAESPFLAANLYNLFYGGVLFGFFSFLPYYAVVRYGMSPLQSGALLTPRGIATVVASALASVFIIPLGYRVPMLLGMFLISASLLLLGQHLMVVQLGPTTISGFWLLSTVVAISGVGMGLANPASNNAAIELAPRQAAEVTGIRGMFRLTGGAFTITTTVLVLSAFSDQAEGLEFMFRVLAVVLLVTSLPLTLMIPDTARERWRREHRTASQWHEDALQSQSS